MLWHIKAMKADHHPTLETAYNRVNIKPSTNDAERLTYRDLQLAANIDKSVG